jgi:hypothetical protein
MTTNFICTHCQSKFTREKTLVVHMCEQKRRHLAKGDRHVQMGFLAYNKFYQLAQKFEGQKSYDEFAKSQYYNAFVKFGSFLHNVNPLYPEHFIDYVVTSGVKLDHWCNETLYERYVLQLIKSENVETALQRSIATMMDWADNNQSVWNHYFAYVSPSRATFDIKDGKISPWILLNSTSGKKLLAQLNDEQLTGISTMIDPEFWIKKFRSNSEDIDLVRQVIKESNL